MQIVQEHTKRIRIEFDDVELGLGQFGAIDLLGVGTDGEAWHGQLIAARLILIFVLTVSVCQVWKYFFFFLVFSVVFQGISVFWYFR